MREAAHGPLSHGARWPVTGFIGVLLTTMVVGEIEFIDLRGIPRRQVNFRFREKSKLAAMAELRSLSAAADLKDIIGLRAELPFSAPPVRVW